MHTSFKYLLTALISFSFFTGVHSQVITRTAYTQGSREQQQIQYLIDHSINYAENMLVKQGAYAPYAAALTVTDSIMRVEPIPGTEKQSLKKIIDDLKATLKAGADKGMYKAVVVYFDVTIEDPETKLPTDAIAAYTEQMNTNTSYTLYFPYKKTELKTLSHTRSLASNSETEIFTKVSKN